MLFTQKPKKKRHHVYSESKKRISTVFKYFLLLKNLDLMPYSPDQRTKRRYLCESGLIKMRFPNHKTYGTKMIDYNNLVISM